jgi:hypothetical protein
MLNVMPAAARQARGRLIAIAASAMLVCGASPAVAIGSAGFHTSSPAMMAAVKTGVTVEPIISVGDVVGDEGYRYESIPDGISLQARGKGRVDLYINHETSTVPFPWAFTGNGTSRARPTVENSQNDFDNAQVSRLALSQKSAGVLNGALVIRSSENYQRFCSNFLATSAQGFDRSLLFTNEETNDVVNRSGTAWPLEAGGSDPQQAGVVVAYDIRTGARRPILGLGRMNHENAVAIPGMSQLTIATGDDTFSSNPPNSQAYLYTAANADAVWNDTGKLWAFKSDVETIDDYYDINGEGTTVPGRFIEVPKAVAVGDQTALETWNQDAANHVFDFIRIEDIAYDRTHPGVIYLADTGRGSGAAPNGRIWKMTLDEQADGIHADLTLLLDFDPAGAGNAASPHQPDNVETTANSLLFTEDPSSGNQFTIGTGTTARLWRYALAGPGAGTLEVIARVDQSQDESTGDVDPTPAQKWGAWESTGVVDASSVFGPGTFLINVQAHSLWVDSAPGPDRYGDPFGATPNTPDGQPDWIYKREGGQLLLLHIPGG